MTGFVHWYITTLPLGLFEWIAYPIRGGYQFLSF